MKKIPRSLERAICEELKGRGLGQRDQREWLKWLRYYLDFCGRYRHPPREEESLQPFLHKLAEKGQGERLQAQAAESIRLFYVVVRQFPSPEEPTDEGRDVHTAWRGCFEKLKGVIKVRQYSPRTLEAYMTWLRQFRGFVGPKPPSKVDSDDAVRFLTYLASERGVVENTQNQAFSALLFFFRHVLEKPFDLGKRVVRARRRRYVPVVLSRKEIDRVVEHIPPPYRLLALVLYGCGLRLAEGLNLRIHCFNFEEKILTVHRGKGGKDRALPLPETLVPELLAHRETVGQQHEEDMAANFAGAFMPRGSEKKWNARAREWIWQFFFPAKTLSYVPEADAARRYHLHEKDFGKSLREASRRAQLDKRVTAHTFRHSFASHLLLANYDIRTIQDMMGHSDVRTTMIYTQTVPSRTRKERQSPLDFRADGSDRPG